MKLRKFATATFLLLAISVVLWIFALNDLGDFSLWSAFISSVIATAMIIILIIGSIIRLAKSRADVNAVFTITMTFITIATFVYALYDRYTDSGFMAGIRGELILMFVVPAEGIILAISFIALIVRRKRNKK